MSRHSKFHKNIIETKSQPKNDNIVNDTLESYIQISLHCLILATETDVVTNPQKSRFSFIKSVNLMLNCVILHPKTKLCQILIKFAFISSSSNANSLLKSFSSPLNLANPQNEIASLKTTIILKEFFHTQKVIK